eukprot:3086875-Amphidinium_carterae.1
MLSKHSRTNLHRPTRAARVKNVALKPFLGLSRQGLHQQGSDQSAPHFATQAGPSRGRNGWPQGPMTPLRKQNRETSAMPTSPKA